MKHMPGKQWQPDCGLRSSTSICFSICLCTRGWFGNKPRNVSSCSNWGSLMELCWNDPINNRFLDGGRKRSAAKGRIDASIRWRGSKSLRAIESPGVTVCLDSCSGGHAGRARCPTVSPSPPSTPGRMRWIITWRLDILRRSDVKHCQLSVNYINSILFDTSKRPPPPRPHCVSTALWRQGRAAHPVRESQRFTAA